MRRVPPLLLSDVQKNCLALKQNLSVFSLYKCKDPQETDIQKEVMEMKKRGVSKMISSVVLLTVSAVLLLTSCAASSASGRDFTVTGTASSSAAMAQDYVGMVNSAMPVEMPVEDGEMAMVTEESVADTSGTVIDQSQRKIVKNAAVRMETMEYDTAFDTINQITQQVGGYIENSSIDGVSIYDQKRGYQSERYASFTVRVPAEQLENYITALGEKFNIINRSESASDISDQYYDSQARLENLEIQEDRLLELLQQAGELGDLLEIERELADVRYEIETLTASINRMDSLVSYSTVNIDLQEVVEYQPKVEAPRTFGDRLMETIKDSGRNFLSVCESALFAFIYAAPVLLLVAAIVAIVVVVLRAIGKHMRKSAAPTPSSKPQEPQDTDQKQ